MRLRYQLTFALMASLLLCFVGCNRPKRITRAALEGALTTEERLRAQRLVKEGEALFDERKLEEAQQKYLEALRTDPGVHEAHLRLGDLYGVWGDDLCSLAEYVAHTETAPKSRLYLKRMLVYVEAKFSRDPSFKQVLDDEDQGLALGYLSQAIFLHRSGKTEQALKLVPGIRRGIPRSGLADYFEAWLLLKLGRADEASAALERSVAANGYFARLILEKDLEAKLPGLLKRISRTLEEALKKHPSDSESSLLLAIIHLRHKRDEDSLKVIREALAWGHPSWNMLFVKAACHHRLGQKLARDQALADITVLGVDLSTAFTVHSPSLFNGLLAGLANDLALGELASGMKEPMASYFRWRLLSEAEDSGSEQARQAFEQWIAQAFPQGEFDDLKGIEPVEKKPRRVVEFLGAVKARAELAMPGFWKCDSTRRAKRGKPSGRLTIQVEMDHQGRVAHVALLENTTEDAVLAYCVIRKVWPLRFPVPMRDHETFKMPVMFGPEIDYLVEKAKAREDARRKDSAVSKEQDGTKQDGTKQESTKQDSTKQDSTKQDVTKQDKG